MADEQARASVQVPVEHGLARLFPTDTISISGKMVLLTWLAFLVTAVLLHRFAWKPILRALDTRERDIRQALEEAEGARRQTAAAAERSRQITDEALERARVLTEEVRRRAERAAAQIEQEARDKSRRLVAEAGREVEAAWRSAAEDLRREAAAMAINLSEKMLSAQLTPEQRRAYAARAIENVPT